MIKKIGQAIKNEYKRERERILRMRRKLKKEGYELEVEMPKIPKKITEGSVRRLKKMTSRSIQEKARRVDTETGEIITARQSKVRAARERGEKRRKPTKTPTPKLPVTPPPLPQMEEPLDEWDKLVDDIRDEIDQIQYKSITYGHPVSQKKMHSDLLKIQNNVSNAFEKFLSEVQQDKARIPEAADIMRHILADEWLVTQEYDSTAIQKAQWVNYMQFASAINSLQLKQELQDMMEEDLTESEDVWEELAEQPFIMDYL